MNAAKITRTSKSNLALAFISLGRERRRAITTFYAFCRVIDDIADDVDLRVEEKRRWLSQWREWVRTPRPNESSFADDVRRLMKKYALAPEMLEEIIGGVEMDLSIKRYQTFEELRISALAGFICRRRTWRASITPRRHCKIDNTTTDSSG